MKNKNPNPTARMLHCRDVADARRDYAEALRGLLAFDLDHDPGEAYERAIDARADLETVLRARPDAFDE